MSALPDDGDLSASQTQSEYKIKMEAVRDILAEQPGAVPQQQITIDGSGQITPPVGCRSLKVIVNTGSADDLGKIIPTNCHDGDQVELVADDPAKPITIKHLVTGDYQIALLGAKDYVMDDANKSIRLCYYGGSAKIWRQVSSGSRVDEMFRMPGFAARADVSIAGDVLTVAQFNTRALPQSSTADNIQEIIASGSGLKLVLVGNSSGNILTFKHNTGGGGKVYMRDAVDLAMSLATQYVLFEIVGADAYEVERFGFASSIKAISNGGRLTLTSGSPVADASAQGTLYWTPGEHGTISLNDGAKYVDVVPGEKSLSLSGSSGEYKSIWGTLSGGTLVLSASAAWTNATTRGFTINRDTYGVMSLSTDRTKRWLGDVYFSGTNQVTDNESIRGVFNACNRAWRVVTCKDTTDNWTFSGTYRQIRGGSTNGVGQFRVLAGEATPIMLAASLSVVGGAVGQPVFTGIGINSNTVNSAVNGFKYEVAGNAVGGAVYAHYAGRLPFGGNVVSHLEYSDASSSTFYGDAGFSAGAGVQSGMTGLVMC